MGMHGGEAACRGWAQGAGVGDAGWRRQRARSVSFLAM